MGVESSFRQGLKGQGQSSIELFLLDAKASCQYSWPFSQSLPLYAFENALYMHGLVNAVFSRDFNHWSQKSSHFLISQSVGFPDVRPGTTMKCRLVSTSATWRNTSEIALILQVHNLLLHLQVQDLFFPGARDNGILVSQETRTKTCLT